jgi:small-conductance mechanosensitive channel
VGGKLNPGDGSTKAYHSLWIFVFGDYVRIPAATKFYVLTGALLGGVIAVGTWWERKQFPSLLDVVNDDTRLFLTQTLFHFGGQPVRVFFLIKTFLFLVFLSLLSHLARHFIRQFARHSPRLDEHREYILSRAVSFAIYAVGILIGVHIERINLSALVLVGGTLGVGIGFGLQSLVGNFVAGLILLVEQPIRLGDRIEFGGKVGEVVRIGMRSSKVRTYDNAILIVPNSEFVAKQILNWTAGDPKIRVTVPVSVAYGSDSEQVMQILLDVARHNADVMREPAPGVLLSDFGPSSITFALRVWTLLKADNLVQLRSDIFLQTQKRFIEKKIEMPFPQMDLHIKSIEHPEFITNTRPEVGQ